MLDLTLLTPKQKRQCSRCGSSWEHPDTINCKRCKERGLERARRCKKWILHRDKVMKPRDMYNMEATKAWIRARRARLGQDINALFEGIDY